jgi:hypothetical protein
VKFPAPSELFSERTAYGDTRSPAAVAVTTADFAGNTVDSGAEAEADPQSLVLRSKRLRENDKRRERRKDARRNNSSPDRLRRNTWEMKTER